MNVSIYPKSANLSLRHGWPAGPAPSD